MAASAVPPAGSLPGLQPALQAAVEAAVEGLRPSPGFDFLSCANCGESEQHALPSTRTNAGGKPIALHGSVAALVSRLASRLPYSAAAPQPASGGATPSGWAELPRDLLRVVLSALAAEDVRDVYCA